MLSQYKLRRLAARTIRVALTHEGNSSVSVIKPVITLSAENFMTSYDKALRLEKESLREYKEGRDAILKFKLSIGELVPAININLPDFAAKVDTQSVPDDMFESVSMLIDDLIDLEQKPEPITVTVIPALENALITAEKEWREAETSRVDLQESQRVLRTNADAFYNDLKLFRRTLASTIGRNHYDYKKLKDNNASTKDPADPQEPQE
jgi:hypothetical protein